MESKKRIWVIDDDNIVEMLDKVADIFDDYADKYNIPDVMMLGCLDVLRQYFWEEFDSGENNG